MASCKLMLNFCWWDQLVFLTFSTFPHHFPRFSWFSQRFPDISRFFPVFFWVFFHQKRFFFAAPPGSARMAPAPPWRPPATLRWMRRWRGWAWGGSCADSWGRSWNWRKMLGITHKQDGAPKIAKLRYGCGWILWFMVDITIVNGVYKPTYTWGAPSWITMKSPWNHP